MARLSSVHIPLSTGNCRISRAWMFLPRRSMPSNNDFPLCAQSLPMLAPFLWTLRAMTSPPAQFGIEYAGLEAMDEIARLIAPVASLPFCCIIRQVAFIGSTRRASMRSRGCNMPGSFPILSRCSKKALRRAVVLTAQNSEAAAKQLAPAVQTLESIMMQHGKHVAGDIVSALYRRRQNSRTHTAL